MLKFPTNDLMIYLPDILSMVFWLLGHTLYFLCLNASHVIISVVLCVRTFIMLNLSSLFGNN